ncbi:Gamma-tubulin complex component 5 [Leucoagaricus sp. SymC.cos]|nr:Gamma-tubulin complex component 5 [Leucoagaricus sp. SymC.cos]
MSTPSNSRPSSSLSRPSSSLSLRQPTSRPSSSASQRPVSSASTTRPRSSASSARPISAASGRPQSRFSQRTQSRLAKSRVNPFAHNIVTQVTGLKEDDDPDEYQKHVDYVVKSLEATTLNKGAASVDMRYVEQQINGHAMKARITMKDPVSEGLLVAFKKLKDHIETREKDLDHDIQTTHIPDHLQFLLNLSQPPSTSTVAHAEYFLDKVKNPPSPTPALTWKDILAEEPFEGEHWEGIFDNSARKERGWDSTPSLSPLSSDIDGAESIQSFSDDGHRQLRRTIYKEATESSDDDYLPAERSTPGSTIPPHTHVHRKEYEDLREIQYWRRDWKGYPHSSKQFDIGDPSTLRAAFSELLARRRDGLAATAALLHNTCYIREEDMVREVLMALQGRRNIVLEWRDDSYATTTDTPSLAHLTLISQEVILASLAETATALEHLRRFRSSVLTLSASWNRQEKPRFIQPQNVTQTVESFFDAVDIEIRAFDTWCADQEATICSVYASPELSVASNPDVIASLLHLHKCLSDTFEHTFSVLLHLIKEVFLTPLSSYSEFSVALANIGVRHGAPAVITSKLLDLLFSSVQVHLEREEAATSGRLMRVFVKTAEPVWGMCGRWLKDGMGLRLPGYGVNKTIGVAGSRGQLDAEFFIEERIIGFGTDGFVGLMHPQFWQEAYELREGAGFDEQVDDSPREQKAVPTFLEHVAEMILSTGKAVGLIRALGSNVDVFGNGSWDGFGDLVALENTQKPGSLFSVSVDTLSRLIYERLLPRCQAVNSLLTKILVDECKVWRHLESLEDLFLMRRGDAMSHFVDVVFSKMDSKYSWSDFHFLNTAFADVVEANFSAGGREWIQSSLVRFSYRGGKDKERTIYRTVKAIDGLSVEYAVPFPLTYIFRPNIIATYSEIFGYLLQIRRAKNVLERILVRGDQRRNFGEGLKVFYAMRNRLSWFINTMLNFLTTYVIHAQVINFHKKFGEAQSLDEMIQLHDDHLNRIQGRCLLKRNTSALHRAILSILDMSLQFSEFFSSLTGDVITHDISRHSSIKRHRNNSDEISSSDDDDGRDGEPEILGNPAMDTETFSTMNTTGSPEEIAERLNKFSSELDGLVRFIRRGVDSLAGGTSEAAPAFGVLAFALEDWDI